jgi:hypothetical protein
MWLGVLRARAKLGLRGMGTGLSAPSAQLLGRCAQGRGEGARGLHVGASGLLRAAGHDSREFSRAQRNLTARWPEGSSRAARRRVLGWAGGGTTRWRGSTMGAGSGPSREKTWQPTLIRGEQKAKRRPWRASSTSREEEARAAESAQPSLGRDG